MEFDNSNEQIINGAKEALGEEIITEKGFTQDDFDNLALIIQEAYKGSKETTMAEYWHEKIQNGDEWNAREIRDCINYLNAYYVDLFDDEFTFVDHTEGNTTEFKSKKYDCIFSVLPVYKDSSEEIVDLYRTNYMEYVYEKEASVYYQNIFEKYIGPCKIYYKPTDLITHFCDYKTSFEEFINAPHQRHEVTIFTTKNASENEIPKELVDIINKHELNVRKINYTIVGSLDICTGYKRSPEIFKECKEKISNCFWILLDNDRNLI